MLLEQDHRGLGLGRTFTKLSKDDDVNVREEDKQEGKQEEEEYIDGNSDSDIIY